jgi:hypothetical protein
MEYGIWNMEYGMEYGMEKIEMVFPSMIFHSDSINKKNVNAIHYQEQ